MEDASDHARMAEAFEEVCLAVKRSELARSTICERFQKLISENSVALSAMRGEGTIRFEFRPTEFGYYVSDIKNALFWAMNHPSWNGDPLDTGTAEILNAVKTVATHRGGGLLKGSIEPRFACCAFLMIWPRVFRVSDVFGSDDQAPFKLPPRSARGFDTDIRNQYVKFLFARWPELRKKAKTQRPRERKPLEPRTGKDPLDLSNFFGGKVFTYGSGTTRKVGGRRDNMGHN